jgi:16S rRNA U516 pseudouridylate synthase RsuA-like enzyme
MVGLETLKLHRTRVGALALTRQALSATDLDGRGRLAALK